MSTSAIVINCAQCDVAITSKYMKCCICNMCFHFSPCCSVQQTTFTSMTSEKKLVWKCHKCRERKNSSYHVVVSDSVNKQKRNDDYDDIDNDEVFIESHKKFKQIPEKQKHDQSQQGMPSITEINDTMKIMMINLTKMTTQLESISQQLQQQQSTLTLINDNVSTLSAQVVDLQKQNQEKEERLNEMEIKVNRLEQKIIEKNIEINNINNDDMSAMDIVKKIATKLDVELTEGDIDKIYHTKGKSKIVVELCSLRKKREIMSKLNRHRVEAVGINVEEENDKHKYIYINDQLTVEKSRLLWLTKKKAKEACWKYVWMRHGNIFVRKMENTPYI